LRKPHALIDDTKINTLTVMWWMAFSDRDFPASQQQARSENAFHLPCCMGLLSLARPAAAYASRRVPIKSVVVSLKGEVLQEEWV